LPDIAVRLPRPSHWGSAAEKREAGANPALPRNCKGGRGEQLRATVLVRRMGRPLGLGGYPSQETCLTGAARSRG